MFFLVNKNKKIIFGWSAKCGCSHIKNIYYFLETNNINNKIHTQKDRNKLPIDIENYITIIITRNPYHRIVSGFLNKYRPGGEFRYKWPSKNITFTKFVDELIKNNYNYIEKHHFIPQTNEAFDKKILLSKELKIYDIGNIDYEYIEKIYDRKIPEMVINKKQGNERQNFILKDIIFDKPVYNLNIEDYIDYNIDIKNFYNEDIKNKVFNFYKNDFIFFKENGIDYTNDL